jgi:predicted transcriptional regulator YdeE
MQPTQYARSGSPCQPEGCGFHCRQFPRSGTWAPQRGEQRLSNAARGVSIRASTTSPADRRNFDYIAGVEVTDFSDLPREFQSVRIPEQKYAVFTHAEHISTIRRTVNTIWNHWLPASGMKAADAPSFERYDEKFDPGTGNGGVEIWTPVRE